MKTIYLVTEIGNGIHYAFNSNEAAEKWIEERGDKEYTTYEILPIRLIETI